MPGNQQAIAPIHGVPAGTHADRDVAKVEAGKRKGVQQFAAGSAVVALGKVGVMAVGIARRTLTRKCAGVEDIAIAGFDIGVFVRLVVPGSAADAKAVVFLVGHLYFAHQVDTVGHYIALVTKLGIGFVVGGVVGQGIVAAFGPQAEVVANRVVPARSQVRITGIELGSLTVANGQGTPDHTEPDGQA
ncbi:hypothetical protein D9M71_512070 [compost metagenome]